MKTLLKKSGIAAAAALLILSVMLVTGCSGPETGSEYTLPPGYGAVRLNFDPIVRTVMPGTSVDDFTSFLLVFTGNGNGGTSYSPSPIDKADIYDAIPLTAGDYLLDVIAYIGTDAGAEANNISFSVSPGILNKLVVITLKPYAPNGTKTGVFGYTVTQTGTLTITAAVINLTQIVGGANTYGPLNVLPIQPTERELDPVVAGYYYVDLAVTRNAVSVTFRHIIHIYPSMKSSYAFVIGDNYFDVALTGIQLVDGKITYEQPDEIKPVLYNGGTEITAAIDLSQTATGGNPASVTITLYNDTDYDSFEWFRGATSLGTTATLIINSNSAPYNVPGRTFFITVRGTKSGIPYSTEVQVNVNG